MEILTLTEADERDIYSIEEFYRKTPFLVAPSRNKQEIALDAGHVFTLKDTSRRVVGVTSIIGMDVPHYFELANSGVSPEWRSGFHFQELFYQVRAAAIGSAYDPVISLLTAVKPDNPTSLHTTRKVGCVPALTPWWGCDDCAEVMSAISNGRDCCHDIFEMPIEAARKLCEEFLMLTQHGAPFERSNGNNTIRIMIDCLFALGEEPRQAIRSFCDAS